MAAPGLPTRGRLDLGAQPTVVVDLAVEDDDVTAAVRSHRLVAGRRQVDDGQPAVDEADAGPGVLPQSDVVGPAMGDGLAHAAQYLAGRFGLGHTVAPVHVPSNSAHASAASRLVLTHKHELVAAVASATSLHLDEDEAAIPIETQD